MTTLPENILLTLKKYPGLSDRELTDIIKGKGEPQQSVNAACNRLQAQGRLKRITRTDGRLGNYLVGDAKKANIKKIAQIKVGKVDPLSEDSIKQVLEKRLKKEGWRVEVAWGRQRGVDIKAEKGGRRWLIEVKGRGSRSAMRVNYFLAVLGETLQRMNDPKAYYSIGLPDLDQFRGLWDRLPELAKRRTGITVIFVDESGKIHKD